MNSAAESVGSVRRVRIDAGRSAADAVAAIRASSADHPGAVLVHLNDTMPQPDHAMVIAAIGPLAIELAPATRLVLIDAQRGAESADIDAAAAFLAAARSTTGQVITIA